jgi:hypothetical protein
MADRDRPLDPLLPSQPAAVLIEELEFDTP